MVQLGSIEEMQKHYKLIEQRKSDECGCPEEEWEIGMFLVIFHLEPNGSGDIFIDCGDWEMERNVSCKDLNELRAQAESWVNSFSINNDL